MVVTGLLQCADKGGDAAWRASDSCRGREESVPRSPPCWNMFVCVCPYMLPLPQALQLMEKAFVLCPDQTAQLFTTIKYGGFPKQIVNKQPGLFLCGADVERETWHGPPVALPA